MPDISGHAILKIVKGVQKVPGDSLSAEVGLDEIDLLDPNGFACDEYDMKLPALKSSAVYADSPLSDGRTLISGTLGNVTETIRLQLTAGTIIQMAAMLSKLGRFKQDCNNYWDTNEQTQPIYIKHQVVSEPGPRYSLLYDIDIDPGQQPLIPSEPKRTVTLVIEREYRWRGLAPGDNPKRWTIEKVMNGQTWDASNAALYQGNDHLVFQQIDNCQEFLTNTTFQSQNFVDIPAASLPGDASPLMCIMVNPSSNRAAKHFIGVTANPTSITDRNGISLPLYNSIPLSSATMASGTAVLTTDTARGIAHVPTSPLKRTVIVTPVGATEVIVATWNAVSFPHFSPLVLRGKYALFLRAVQIGGTAGTVTSRITFTGGGAQFDSELQRIADDTATGSEINYMGTFELPLSENASVSIDGKGNTAETGFSISLSVMRSAGVGTIRLIDMFWLPLGNYVYINHTLSGLINRDIYDDTGYLSHGKPDPMVTSRDFLSAVDQVFPAEATGELHLTPGVNNRVYFMEYADSVGAQADRDMVVRINVIPCWLGYRDV